MTVAAMERHESEALDQKAFGFWLFLMGDAILFGLLFATYVVMTDSTASGPSGHALFTLWRAAAETALLLVSSITFGFATLAMLAGRRGPLLAWLAVTLVLGLAFVALEIGEFSGMIAQGAGPDRSGFLSAFFTLVSTHGLHVSFGMIWIVILALQVMTKGLTPPVCSRLFRLGLFWHFLDIVWIGIYSVVYLPGILG